MAAELEVLNVKVRDTRGKRNARRMRRAGSVPAVLYGHAQDSVSLTIPGEELETAMRHGSRVVELKGGVSDTAMIYGLQWDTWGTHVLHMDLMRVSADQEVEVEVPVELRGEAPGVKSGGVLEHPLHSVQVRCPATAVPEKLECNINHLELGESMSVSDLTVPEGVTVLSDATTLVVQIVEPVAEEEEEEAAGETAEPEVIGRKPSDEEEGGEG